MITFVCCLCSACHTHAHKRHTHTHIRVHVCVPACSHTVIRSRGAIIMRTCLAMQNMISLNELINYVCMHACFYEIRMYTYIERTCVLMLVYMCFCVSYLCMCVYDIIEIYVFSIRTRYNFQCVSLVPLGSISCQVSKGYNHPPHPSPPTTLLSSLYQSFEVSTHSCLKRI